MRNEYKKQMANKIASHYVDLEERIIQDIVRRIVKTGEITSTADWQINRLKIIGYSSEDIEKMLKTTLNKSYPEIFELYDNVINWEYVRNKCIYEQINVEFIPLEKNEHLKQSIDAIIKQSLENLKNITGSLGFCINLNGKKTMTPLSQVYTKYLDNACLDIASGAFDYNSVLRRVVLQLTNSGLRTIDYASGWHNRVDVAARRAVMTGLSQITGKITEYNADKLGTTHFEVAWHAGARPTHSVWQGKVWTKDQLVSVCGLGTVTGLLGANCYHEYYPFFPGISERNWTDKWLEEKNKEESKPKEFDGKQYTVYEAKQRQRRMETAMRAQRQKVRLMEDGGADRNEIMLHKAKYQAQLGEYSRFSKRMGLKQERERIYLDMRGRVASKNRHDAKQFPSKMIQNAGRDITQYKKYKDVLGSSIGSLAEFGRMKYNDDKRWGELQKKYLLYQEINAKSWSTEFKEKSKQAYDRFAEVGITMSAHALSRLSRLYKQGYAPIDEEEILWLIRRKPNYSEGEDKIIWFSQDKQLAIIKNKTSGDIVSIVRRKNKKESWKDVSV